MKVNESVETVGYNVDTRNATPFYCNNEGFMLHQLHKMYICLAVTGVAVGKLPP